MRNYDPFDQERYKSNSSDGPGFWGGHDFDNDKEAEEAAKAIDNIADISKSADNAADIAKAADNAADAVDNATDYSRCH